MDEILKCDKSMLDAAHMQGQTNVLNSNVDCVCENQCEKREKQVIILSFKLLMTLLVLPLHSCLLYTFNHYQLSFLSAPLLGTLKYAYEMFM